MNFCIINIFYFLEGKKRNKWKQTNTKRPNLKHRKVPQGHKIMKELRFKPRLPGSRVHPLNHSTDCLPWKTTLKNCWLKRNEQNESCELSFVWVNMRTAAWETAPQITLRNWSKEGGRDRQYICDFGKRGVHGITTNEGNSSSDGSTRPPYSYLSERKPYTGQEATVRIGYGTIDCCHPT